MTDFDLRTRDEPIDPARCCEAEKIFGLTTTYCTRVAIIKRGEKWYCEKCDPERKKEPGDDPE